MDEPTPSIVVDQSSSEPRLLGRLVLVLVLFVMFSLPLLLFGRGGHSAIGAARERLPVAIAIVGDSRAHVGVSPSRMSGELAKAGLAAPLAYNFAADGTDALHQFDLVDRALAAAPGDARPRVIVWAPNPLGFNDRRTNNRLQQLVGMDLVTLVRAGAPTELALDLVTMRVFPPYARRPVLAEKVGTYVEIAGKKTLPLQRRLFGLHFEEPPKSREYRALPDGHEPFTILDWQDRFERGEQGYLADYAGLGANTWHLAIGRALLERARAAGILVVIVELPVSPWFRDHLGRDQRHLNWRQALVEAARQEGALYWDHTARYDDDRRFGDPAHMADELAFEYSAELGRDLAADPMVRAALVRAR